ncbi:HAD-IIIC family phosphatase [Butyrivibrio sp. X503]|uniref:HAD-IIIC family phosphatase n=1 Tax=Butyrivibrio sp. X503 TaxID=2364878 RepID=UPI000EA99174|nr:HAD-IIIC family phosphatase [Butyrivibrio sp. X503]RKM54431.1 HAD-IIIC family phosphatase [Butyrivibrio sp. X503]
MDTIKLVIWDLDNTLWKGILAEEEVCLFDGRKELINNLVDRGIMVSISSKNDYDKAKAKLEELGLFDLFIFPDISFDGKGESVKHILSQAKLRAENTLFIDDNITNRKEAEYYNKGIKTADPIEVDNGTILRIEKVENDGKHYRERLKQYKNMELRDKSKRESSSDKDFLFQSDIEIDIRHNCIDVEDRIYELINRTNQLNYTKKRLTKIQTRELLTDNTVETAYILAKDKYGDYGIIGFYAVAEGKLEHFLFSCRILGLGIEQYIYKKLGCPILNIEGDIAVELSDETIDWISESYIDYHEHDTDESKILMIGGCDLEGMKYYIADSGIRTEFSTVEDGVPYKRSYTNLLLGNSTFTEEMKGDLCEKIPFLNYKISFSSEIYGGKYPTIVWSLVDDYICCVYKYKENPSIEVSIGDYYDDKNNDTLNQRYGKDKLKWFYENFEFVGLKDKKQFYDDLVKIISNIGENIRIVLVNGTDLDVSDWIGEDRVRRNIEMNNVIDEVVRLFPNVKLLDMRKIVKRVEDLPKKDNRHFSRQVYYKMAQELESILSDQIGVIERKKIISSDEELVKTCLLGNIFLYGAGLYGRSLESWAKDKSIQVDGYIETNPVKSLSDNGIKIYAINEIPSDAHIIVSVGNKFKDDVIRNIQAQGISEFYIITEDFWEEIKKCAR